MSISRTLGGPDEELTEVTHAADMTTVFYLFVCILMSMRLKAAISHLVLSFDAFRAEIQSVGSIPGDCSRGSDMNCAIPSLPRKLSSDPISSRRIDKHLRGRDPQCSFSSVRNLRM
jgi:hypothetical protein